MVSWKQAVSWQSPSHPFLSLHSWWVQWSLKDTRRQQVDRSRSDGPTPIPVQSTVITQSLIIDINLRNQREKSLILVSFSCRMKERGKQQRNSTSEFRKAKAEFPNGVEISFKGVSIRKVKFRREGVERQTDRQIDKQTDEKRGEQASRQVGRQKRVWKGASGPIHHTAKTATLH